MIYSNYIRLLFMTTICVHAMFEFIAYHIGCLSHAFCTASVENCMYLSITHKIFYQNINSKSGCALNTRAELAEGS